MRNRCKAAGALAIWVGVAGAAFAQDAAQIEAGEGVFRRCAACHEVGPDAGNKIGPELADVVGRTPGTVEDFNYSPAMVEYGAAGNVWNDETLHAFLENPKALVPGTKMTFAGLKKPEDRDAVIAFIASQQAAN